MSSEPSVIVPDCKVGVPWRGLALLLMLVVGLALLHVTGVLELLTWETMRGHLDEWQAIARAQPFLVIGLFLLAYIALTSLSLPAAPMLCLSGALFDHLLGTCVSSACSVVAASLMFLSCRHLFRDWVRGRFNSSLARIDAGVERDGAWYLLSLRLCPMLPFTVVNVTMSVTAIRWRTFAFVTWLGMLPACLLYGKAGSELGRLQTPQDALTPTMLGSLLLLSLLPLAMRWLMHRLQPGEPAT